MHASSRRAAVLIGQSLRRAAVFLVVALFVARCDFVDSPSPSKLVVEAFLLSGEPLPEIVLRQTRGLRDPVPPEDSTADAATGAVVTVAIGSDTVAYLPGAVPGRYRPSRSVIAEPGTAFFVRVRWQGEVATAEGRVPEPIRIDQACARVPEDPVEAILVDSLRRDSLDIPAEQGYIFPIDVAVDWRDSSDDDSWVRAGIRPSSDFSSGVVELFLQPVEVDRESDFSLVSESTLRRHWVGVYAISSEDSLSPVPAHEVTVSLTRGDSAFAAFATSRTDPERREPVSNVDGGIGIATAVALDTLRLAVPAGTSGERCESP